LHSKTGHIDIPEMMAKDGKPWAGRPQIAIPVIAFYSVAGLVLSYGMVRCARIWL
jgi:hypothetical protein